MKIYFTETAWSDYLYWQGKDKKIIKRINQLIQDIDRNGNDGIGKPEALKGDLSGWWSRRIDNINRCGKSPFHPQVAELTLEAVCYRISLSLCRILLN